MAYTVKAGDTLGAIAKQLGTDVSNLTGYSSGNPNLIRPGEVITVRGQQPAPAPNVQQQTRVPQSTGGSTVSGSYFDSAKNEGYHNGQKFVDVNKWRAAGGRDSATGGASAGGFSLPQQPTIDLQAMYKKMFDSSNIKQEEAALTAKQQEATTLKNQLAEAETDIGDDPFISESMRVGRVNRRRTEAQKKLDTILEEQNQIQGRIEKQKADIEMKLNMQMKQFDINSQQAQQALSNLNTYMSLGLLDNASDAEIAQLTRSTGISSSMIQGAIQAKKDEEKEVALQYIEDDNGNVNILAIDKSTGAVVNQSTVSGIGKVTKASGGSTKTSEKEDMIEIQNYLKQDARRGLKLSEIFSKYSGYVDPNTIYQLYNANSKYGPDKNAKALKGYGVTVK